MRLVSYGPVGDEQPGVLLDEQFIAPLWPLLTRMGFPAFPMNELLGELDGLRPVIERALTDSVGDRVPAGSVRLGPPVPRPGKVLAVGGNYPQHTYQALVAGTRPAADDATAQSPPVLFIKPGTSVSGPYDAVIRPPETTMLDYEVELGVVIGRPGRRISASDAHRHIVGYVVTNDITARDIAFGPGLDKLMQHQIARAKGYPTFCPMGPWLVTLDGLDAPGDLRLELSVNGELRQSGSTAEMLVGVAELIESVSVSMPLESGDVLLTGTTSGCGFQLDPPGYLNPGDEVTASIAQLGEMRFRVVDEQPGSAAQQIGGSSW